MMNVKKLYYQYLFLSIWIFLLIAGMCKYIGSSIDTQSLRSGKGMFSSTAINDETSEFKKYKEHCTPTESISRKDDGGILDGWKLQGVLLVIRHGDRGPMSHVRGISNIDCGVEDDVFLTRYKTFLTNTSYPSGTSHLYWNKMGPFHGISLLPPTPTSCLLGLLTYKGISQLLRIGEIMQQVYSRPLGLFLKPNNNNKAAFSSTPHSLLNSDEVIVYTTRCRRTFQSAMALMFAFLPQEKWLSLNLHESHSISFCFSDCTCSKADVLRERLLFIGKETSQHSAVSAVVQWIGQSLLQHTIGTSSPHEVMDAVLTLICHNAPLPCKKSHTVGNSKSKSSPITFPSTQIDQNDVINIDQDDMPSNPNNNINNPDSTDLDDNEFNTQATEDGCIEQSHITALMSFTNWQSSFFSHHPFYKHIGLLRAYGMIRNIVSFMLKMISGDRTKFVLYSGHDWTMQYLTAALGITIDTAFIPYAARLAFEVYRSDTQTDYYFRVIYNGKDVTQQIDFCEGGKSLRVTRDSRGNKADLCPIENIIRFIHDDYFSPLNATNFKDACMVSKNN